MSGYAPKPLNPRDAASLIQHLSPGDCVRITTTELPRTICTVKATNPATHCGPQLILTALPITTTAQDELQHATFHCTSQPDSAMTVLEYTHTATDTTTRCIGSLTTHDLSKNKERATFVWAAFHERARRGHGKMRLPSWLVKQILDDHNLDTNPNTVRRVMEFIARGTSRSETPNPEDDSNLVTLKHRNEKNVLVADEDEWESFFAAQVEHVNTEDEGADTKNQRSDDGSDDRVNTDTVTKDVDEEFDVLSSAAPITSDEDKSITEEITVS